MWRWGIVGTGGIANDFALAMRQVANRGCVAAVASASGNVANAESLASRLRLPAVEPDVDALLARDDVSVVYVASTNEHHAPVAAQCLTAGKHVLLEKPMCLRASDTRELARMATDRRLLLAEAMWTRHFPAMKYLRSIVHHGHIGDVRSVLADFGLNVPHSVERMWQADKGGGALYDLGVYPLWFASLCAGGERPAAVAASGALGGNGVDDWTAVDLTYSIGQHAHLVCGMDGFTREEWAVTGTAGRVTVHSPAHTPTRLTIDTWPAGGDARQHMESRTLTLPASLGDVDADTAALFKYPGSAGLAFQLDAVHRALDAGLTQLPDVPLAESVRMADVVDTALTTLGVERPAAALPVTVDGGDAGPPVAGTPVPVTVVGVGVPGASIGWAHAVQLLTGQVGPLAALRSVVEPWYTRPDVAGTPAAAAFQPVANRLADAGVVVWPDVDTALPPRNERRPQVVVIAARTADNPELFNQVVPKPGVSHVLLEKPGAPTVDALLDMQRWADTFSVEVCLGFHKHLSGFANRVKHAADTADTDGPVDVVLTSTNTYTPDQLRDCFIVNAEGMARNMMIHELALVVDHHGLTVDTITDVAVNPPLAPFTTHRVDAGDGVTDFARLAVRLDGSNGRRVTLCAARCAPTSATRGAVYAGDRQLLATSDAEGAGDVDSAVLGMPSADVRPYIIGQWRDYAALKRRLVEHVAAGHPGLPPDVATMDTAIQAMRLAAFIDDALADEPFQDPATSPVDLDAE